MLFISILIAAYVVSVSAFVANKAESSEVALVLLQREAKYKATLARQNSYLVDSQAPLKVFVYPYEDIQMFHGCWKEQLNAGDLTGGRFKHNVDHFFVKYLLSDNFKGVPPEEAELFVVPGLCSQSARGVCKHSHSDNVQQLAEYLDSSQWFGRYRGHDHFMMCDFFGAFPELNRFDTTKELIIGTFESNWAEHTFPYWSGRSVGVGYTIPSAFSMCEATQFEGWQNRKYDVHSIHAVSPTKDVERIEFGCAVLQGDHDVSLSDAAHKSDNNLVYIKINQQLYDDPQYEPFRCDGKFAGAERYVDNATRTGEERFTWSGPFHYPANYSHDDCDGIDSMAFSRIVMSLMGDTPTTDRFIEAFEKNTPVAVLSSQRSAILERLPFRDMVPWSSLLVEIDAGEFKRSPLQAIEFAKLNVNIERWNKIVEKMQHYRDDVLWHSRNSHAAQNVLREASALAKRMFMYVPATKKHTCQPMNHLIKSVDATLQDCKDACDKDSTCSAATWYWKDDKCYKCPKGLEVLERGVFKVFENPADS